MSVHYDASRTYTYLKGMVMGLGFQNSINSLAFARKAHQEQLRKNGEPYIVHPLTMASHVVSLGWKEDDIISAALLHDVVEDCNMALNDLLVSDKVRDSVRRLTHRKLVPLREYYREISEDRVSSIVKLIDRCNNVSTMAGVFTLEKVESYIQETRDFVLPLIRTTKDQWPADSDKLFVLRYHIQSVIDGLEAVLMCLESRHQKNEVTL